MKEMQEVTYLSGALLMSAITTNRNTSRFGWAKRKPHLSAGLKKRWKAESRILVVLDFRVGPHGCAAA